MLKSEKNIFWGIIIVFVITRIVIILFFISTIFAWDDGYVGFISTELLSGNLKLPLFDYIRESRNLSIVIPAFFLMPFLFIFGNNIIAIKLFALCVATLNLCIWYFVLRNVSLRTAFLFSLLYICTPTMLTNIMLIAWTPYSIISLCMGASLLLFIKILNSEHQKLFHAALLGFVCGVGSWIYYVLPLLLPFMFFFWGVKDKLFFLKKQFMVFIILFVIGISPWLFYNIDNNFSSLLFLGKDSLNLDFEAFLYKFKRIFTLFMPNFFFYRGTPMVVGYAYYILFILSFVAVTTDIIKNFKIIKFSTPAYTIKFIVAAFLFIYVLMFCVIPLQAMDIRARYIALVWPFLLSVIALGLTYISPFLQKIFLVILIICYTFTYSYRMPYQNFMEGLSEKGDSYYFKLGKHLVRDRDYNAFRFSEVLEKFPLEKQENILRYYVIHKINKLNRSGLPEFRFLVKKYNKKFDIFCDVFNLVNFDQLGFKKSLNRAINICGKAHNEDWKGIWLRTINVFEIVSAIESLNDNHDKETMYFFLGKLLSKHSFNNIYEFYKEIPRLFRYRYIQGYVYSELFSMPEDFFFQPEHIDNFDSIEIQIQEILSFIPHNDEECIRDVYVAYISSSYVLVTLVNHDDYETIPMNKKIFANYLKEIKDKEIVFDIRFRIKEILKKEKGFFSKMASDVIILENEFLSKSFKKE